MSVQMSEAVRKALTSDCSLRERMQDELDRILPIEFDGYVEPTPSHCCVKDVDGCFMAYIP